MCAARAWMVLHCVCAYVCERERRTEKGNNRRKFLMIFTFCEKNVIVFASAKLAAIMGSCQGSVNILLN